MGEREPNWWEPPLAGDEVSHLIGALDRLRATFRFKADGLDEKAMRVTIGASSLTIGGLLMHLASVEDWASTKKITGEEPGPPWDSRRPHDQFDVADDVRARDLYALYDGAVERARARTQAVIANGGLDQSIYMSDGEGHHASLRRALFDLVEEYGRHTGHADLIREAIDGRVGEDPPDGWRRESY
jgi:hypothetical protein